ncbi:hypothetical protein NADFUDRAFT_51256 [Nadsonia fulvescens var. elongata DSM 6958]|uniref:GPALPP motifs-containing protein 1 n=1 Tax=Nadsonia fulvescens var. elongata DSM 6958 TaxID=857566 RepID=A0A1E3PKP8_9ASCO|nr:hypothetical protein NADFUDRAFT_51256 [Nadsonia fulvescens var. elongata DSM 6958]
MNIRKARLEKLNTRLLVKQTEKPIIDKNSEHNAISNEKNGEPSEIKNPVGQIGPSIQSTALTRTHTAENISNVEDKAKSVCHNDSGSSSEDEDYGPSLPKQNLSIEEQEEQALDRLEQFKSISDNGATRKGNPLRDEWMYLAPRDLKDAFDDKKKGRGKSRREQADDIDDSWMETNAQTKKRLADEMMGLATGSSSRDSNKVLNQKSNQETKKPKHDDFNQPTKVLVESRPSMLDEHLHNRGANSSHSLNEMVMRAQGITSKFSKYNNDK